MGIRDAWDFLALAQDDLSAATILIREPHQYHNACFHAQQAAEKALKAVLLGEGIHFSKHHDLERLVDLIRQNDATFPPFTKECAILNEYGVDARYDPRMRDEVDRDEAQEAITLAQSIVAQCRHMLET